MAEIKAMKPQSGCLQSHIGVPGESAYQIAVDHGYVGITKLYNIAVAIQAKDNGGHMTVLSQQLRHHIAAVCSRFLDLVRIDTDRDIAVFSPNIFDTVGIATLLWINLVAMLCLKLCMDLNGKFSRSQKLFSHLYGLRGPIGSPHQFVNTRSFSFQLSPTLALICSCSSFRSGSISSTSCGRSRQRTDDSVFGESI